MRFRLSLIRSLREPEPVPEPPEPSPDPHPEPPPPTEPPEPIAEREAEPEDPGRAGERAFLLLHVRRFATAAGELPTELDALVRETFGADLVRVA